MGNASFLVLVSFRPWHKDLTQFSRVSLFAYKTAPPPSIGPFQMSLLQFNRVYAAGWRSYNCVVPRSDLKYWMCSNIDVKAKNFTVSKKTAWPCVWDLCSSKTGNERIKWLGLQNSILGNYLNEANMSSAAGLEGKFSDFLDDMLQVICSWWPDENSIYLLNVIRTIEIPKILQDFPRVDKLRHLHFQEALEEFARTRDIIDIYRRENYL